MTTKQETHSPGPWQFDGQVILDADGGHVASPIGCDVADIDDEPIANAQLIAAAPDLLAACERVMQLAVSVEGDEVFSQVKVAIAKARGETSQPTIPNGKNFGFDIPAGATIDKIVDGYGREIPTKGKA